MDLKRFDLQRFVSGLKGVPSWIWITLGTLTFSGVVMGIIFITGAIAILNYKDPVIALRDFESQDHSYQIKLPKGWFPYESQEGIHGDPYLVVQAIEGSRVQPTFDIARIEKPDAELDQIVDWGITRASNFPNTTLSSIPYDTSLNEGTLLIYTIPEAGYQKKTIECHDWITYNNPFGYIVSMCTIPEDWARLDEPFKEMIESFRIKY